MRKTLKLFLICFFYTPFFLSCSWVDQYFPVLKNIKNATIITKEGRPYIKITRDSIDCILSGDIVNGKDTSFDITIINKTDNNITVDPESLKLYYPKMDISSSPKKVFLPIPKDKIMRNSEDYILKDISSVGKIIIKPKRNSQFFLIYSTPGYSIRKPLDREQINLLTFKLTGINIYELQVLKQNIDFILPPKMGKKGCL